MESMILSTVKSSKAQHNNTIISLHQDISFTDPEISVAAHLAYLTISGSRKTITTADVFTELGIVRGSRIWEARNEIIKPQRICKVLKAAGFSRTADKDRTRKARFIIINGDPNEET